MENSEFGIRNSETYLSALLRCGFLRHLAKPHLSQVRAWYTLGSRTYFVDGNRLRTAIEKNQSKTQVLYLASTWPPRRSIM